MKKILLVFCVIIINEICYAQHTLVLNPVSDCYVETYGGGVGKNSFLKFDITSIPFGAVLTNTKLRAYVSSISASWDGDLKIIRYANQTWLEGDSNNIIWQPLYFTDTIIQLIGFGMMPGWAETVDINSLLDMDFQVSNTYFSVLLKDVDDPTFAPNSFGISIDDNDSLMSGNIFSDNIVFRPREWVNAPPELVIDYGIPPTVQPVFPVSPVCEQSSVMFSITANGDSPFTYQWQFNGVDISGANSDTYSITTAQLTDAGNYTCIVSNSYGVDTSGIIILGVNSLPLISITSTDVDCFGNYSGSIDMTVTGGTPPYFYMWSDGSTTEDLNGLNGGMYYPTVIDANGCTASTSVTINEPAPLVDMVSSTDDNGSGNGTASVAVGGGTPPYIFQWDDPFAQTTSTATNLYAGWYHVTVTDANLCSVTDSVEVLLNTGIVANKTNFSFTICPNPSNGNFRLIVNNVHYNNNYEIKIINVIGNIVYEKTLLSGDETISIDLPGGIYLLNVKGGVFIQTKILEITE